MQSRLKILSDRGSARLFMENSPKRRLLLSLVPNARTVSGVARSERMPIGRVHYLFSEFVRRGLAFVETEEKRAGRSIKHYRASAESYLVPLEHVSSSPGAGLAAELRRSLDDALAQEDDEGILFYVTEGGDPRVSWFGERDRRQPVAEFWQILRLSEGDARELIADLEELLKAYQERGGEGRVFLIHSAVAPRR